MPVGPASIASVAITSTPTATSDGDTYGRGEKIEITVTWDKDVAWDVSAAGSDIRVRLDVAGNTKAARLVRAGAASGTARSLKFRYQVGSGDTDTNGVFPKPNAQGDMVLLVGAATLAAADGTAAGRAHAALSADANHKVDGPNQSGDNTAPEFQSATVNGTTLTITFDEALDTAHVPAGINFGLINPDGTGHSTGAFTGTPVSISGSTVTVTLQTAAVGGRTYTVSYSHHSSAQSRLQDAAGNEVAEFTGQPVTNNTPPSPRFESAAVNGATLTITFDKALDTTHVSFNANFFLRHLDGSDFIAGLPGTRVSISGRTVTVTLATAAVGGRTYTVDYALAGNPAARLQDAAGREVAAFSGEPVTNNTPGGTPQFESAAVNGTTLTITFDKALDTAHVPQGAGFRLVNADGTTHSGGTSAQVSISGSTVTVTLQTTAFVGRSYTVTYSPSGPTSSRLQDTAGNIVARFSGQAVSNDTPNNTAPRFVSAAVDGRTLTVTFHKALNPSNRPTASQWGFRRSGGGSISAQGLSTVSGNTVTVTLASAAVPGSTYILRYTRIGIANRHLEDAGGREVAPFSGQPVTNDTPSDASVTAATLAGTTLTLTFSRPVSATAAPPRTDGKRRELRHAFLVIGTLDGGYQHPDAVRVSGTKVTLTLGTVLPGDRRVTLSYYPEWTDAKLIDAGGGAVAHFADRAVEYAPRARTPTGDPGGLVSNTGQNTDGTTRHGTDRAQPFTTGSNAAGYTLTGVTFPIQGIIRPGHTQVRIESSGSDGRPGGSLGALSLDSSVGMATGTTAGIDLDADTTYFVVLLSTDTSNSNRYERTNSNNEDSGGAAGWSIGDGSLWYGGTGTPTWTSTSGTSWKIALHGHARVGFVGPLLERAEVVARGENAGQTLLRLTFDKALDPASLPAGRAFLVHVTDPLTEYVTRVRGTGTAGVLGTQVEVTLSEGVDQKAGFQVSYEPPESGPLQDEDGIAVAGFASRPVAVIDRQAPGYASGSVAGRQARVYFNEALAVPDLASTPAVADFAVTVAGSTRRVDRVAVDGNAVILTLATAAAAGETVTVSYTPGQYPLLDLAGNEAAAFGAKTLDNQGPGDPGAPALVAATDPARARAKGTRVTLGFTQPLDPASLPAPAAFAFRYTVTAADGLTSSTAHTVDTVLVQGKTVVLGLNGQVYPCDSQIELLYAKPDENPLRNLFGTAVEGFATGALTNEHEDECEQWTIDGGGYRKSGTVLGDGNLFMGMGRMLREDTELRGQAFSVKATAPGGATRTLPGTGMARIEGETVRVRLAAPPAPGETLAASYARPPGEAGIMGAAGSQLADFADVPVENGAAAAGPRPVDAAVDGRTLTIAFDRDLAPAQAAPERTSLIYAFFVKGTAVAEQSPVRVAVAGRTVTLGLGTGAADGQRITVSYAPGRGEKLRDAAGKAVAAFADLPVRHGAAVAGAAVVSDAGPDGAYGEGARIEAAVTFTAPVTVATDGGTPALALIAETGDGAATVRRAAYAAGSGTARLVFAYRVSEADGSLRAARVAASGLKLNGGSVAGADGAAALLAFGAAPGVTGVSVADEADGQWAAGDTVAVTLRFAEPVTVSGAPSVGLVLEGAVRRAAYAGGSGTDALTFGYTLADGDGPWSRASVAGDSLDPGGGSIESTGGGLAALLPHPAAARALKPPAPEPARFVSAAVAENGAGLMLTFSKEIATGGAHSAWAVTVDGAARATRSSLWDANTVGLVLAAPVLAGETVQVSYANPGRGTMALVDADGLAVADFGPVAVANALSAPPPGPAPLTAAFVGVPAEHDGRTRFSFELRFSENFPGRLPYKVLKDHALQVTNGRAVGVKRAAPHQNQRWTITVRPWSADDVTVTLPAAADCAAPGSVCTEAGRKLANTVTARVLGPALISVADAEAREGVDEAVAFPVTLNRAASGTVTVDYATADGSAVAGEDYRATSGTLTFAAGETEKTVSVPILDDGHDEGRETFLLRLSNAAGAHIADGEATGTIVNADPIPKAWLARFGRTVTGQVLDAVEARLAAPRQAGAQAALAGQALPSWAPGSGGDAKAANDNTAAERAETGRREAENAMRRWMAFAGPEDGSVSGTGPGSVSGTGFGGFGDGSGSAGRTALESRALTQRDLLTGTSFALTAGSAGPGGGFATLWGRGAIASFDGREGDLRLDGEVSTGLLGADWASDPGSGAGRWTAGFALGHSSGTGGYRRGGCAPPLGEDDPPTRCGGSIEATLTGLYPYAGVTLSDRLSVWAAAGHGAGEVTVRPDGSTARTADLAMTMGAAGMRSEVLRPADGAGLALAVKGDARFTRTESEAVRGGGGNLAAAEADVWLVRTGIEGSRPFALPGPGSGAGKAGGASVTPSFEIGVRLDGGDAETGLGADLGGGLAFAYPGSGLTLDLKARGLLAHEASGFREWGASGSVAWDPRPSTDRGLALTLTRSWGAAPAGGMDALLGRETLAGLAADEGAGGGFEAAGRLEGEIGYGLPAFGGGFTGTPNLGFALSDGGARDWRLGWRLTSAIRGDPSFEVSLDATRREPANDNGAGAEHGVMLGAAIRW